MNGLWRTIVVVVAALSLVVTGSVGAAEKKVKERVAVKPFNGTNLDGWKLQGDAKASHWTVGTASMDPKEPKELAVEKAQSGQGEMVNSKHGGVDIYTEQKFGDCTISMEYMVPKGSNSGIYLMGEYELQILDSYGREKMGTGDNGGLYSMSAPKVNASKKPGEWQQIVIQLRAPRFKDGKKVENGKLRKVTLNGQVIHENVEIKGVTPGGLTGQEHATAPLMIQGNHGPVALRNIVVTTAVKK